MTSAICAVSVAVLPAPAWAHLDAAADTDPDGATKVTFSFNHGCEDAPTTSLRIQLPAEVSEIKPEDPPNWTSQVTGAELTWRGAAIGNGSPAMFVATMRIKGKPGDVIYFPTVQGCALGRESLWLERAADPEASQAAPRFTIGEAATGAEPGGGAHAEAATPGSNGTGDPGTASVGTAPNPTAATSSTSKTPFLIGMIVVASFVLGGGFALSKRGPTKP